nr:5252_t:CDS:2 [Entrophospora candida]
MNKRPRKEPSDSINCGRQFTGVWRQFIQGQEKGNGIYEGECISCHKKCKKWAFAKPGILCSHLANECNKCGKDVKQYYNRIITNNIHDNSFGNSYEIPDDWVRSTSNNRKISNNEQSKVDSYYGSTSIEPSLLSGRFLDNQVAFKHYQKLHETRWTSVHECLDSIIQLKRCLEEIHDEHSFSISNNSVISILRSRAFFEDVGYLANTLLPIKLAILEVEGREESNIPDCELDVQVVIEFNSCVFEMFNKNNIIEELDGGFFDEETGGDDYDPIEVAHESMGFEDYYNV